MQSMQKQKGIVLLLLLAGVLAVGAYIVLAELNNQPRRPVDQAQTAKALREAKEALLGYALAYANPEHSGQPPGYLPCPDKNGDGSANSPCAGDGQSVIGRLPWRTLGIDEIRDGSGECLWYVVSGTYKNNPKSLNSNSDGMLEVVDITDNTLTEAIAIVFSPGERLGQSDGVVDITGTSYEQDRSHTGNPEIPTCGGTVASDPANQAQNYLENYAYSSGGNNFTVSNYLGVKVFTGSGAPATPGGSGSIQINSEAPSTSLNSVFIKATPIQNFNDSMIWITPDDYEERSANNPSGLGVYKIMDEWMADYAHDCLIDYFVMYSEYPWLVPLDNTSAPHYTDAGVVDTFFGRIPSFPTPAWPSDEYGGACFNEEWWNDWREHVFIALHKDVAPDSTNGFDISFDGLAADFVILVAGRRLEVPPPPQSRNDVNLAVENMKKASIENYLEEENSGVGIMPADHLYFSDGGANSNDITCSQASPCPP